MVAGGVGREKQTFSRRAAEANAGLLVVAVAAMLFPAIFHLTAINLHDVELVEHETGVSVGTSIILLIVYVLGLFFTLKTHAHLFSHPRHSENCPPEARDDGGTWSVGRAVTMLFLVAFLSFGWWSRRKTKPRGSRRARKKRRATQLDLSFIPLLQRDTPHPVERPGKSGRAKRERKPVRR